MTDLRAKDIEAQAKERQRRRELYTLKKKRKAVRMAKLDAKIAANKQGMGSGEV